MCVCVHLLESPSRPGLHLALCFQLLRRNHLDPPRGVIMDPGKHLVLGDAKFDVPTWTCQSSPIHHKTVFHVSFSSGVTTECAITKAQLAEMGSGISPGDQRTNHVVRRRATAYRASAQVGGMCLRGGGDTMPWMEKVPLFLVICVTTVLIDDHWDVFPTLPLLRIAALRRGFPDRPLASKPYSGLALSPVPQHHPSTLCSVWGSRWLLPTHLDCKTLEKKA